jgi:hypothetical protein
MKRLLLIGVTACTFALAPILSESAMPSATRMHLSALTPQSSKYTAGAITGAELITTDGVEAITMDGATDIVGPGKHVPLAP